VAKPKWTAAAVVDALRVSYGVTGVLGAEEWALLTEVPLRARTRDAGSLSRWSANERTIDVMLVRSWSGAPGFRRLAFEVKVSRSDYRNETDHKRHPAEVSAHQCYYLTPAGLIRPEELPPGWGLMEVHADLKSFTAARGWSVGGGAGLIKTRVRAAERTPTCEMDYLVSAFARRASRAEERIRRGEEEATQIPALRADVERLQGQLTRRDEALHKAREQTRTMLAQFAAVQPQVCAECRKPVAYDPRRSEWKHPDAQHQQVCLDARTEADRLAREARFGARYQWGYPDPVEPLSIREALRDDTRVTDV
jgi:hypothetical protein